MGQLADDGEGAAVQRTNLLRLAEEGGARLTFAKETIDRMAEVAGDFQRRAGSYPIRRATVRHLPSAIERCRSLVSRL